MPDESEFLELAQGMMGHAENLHTYFQSCISSGFDEEQSLMLVLNMQEAIFREWQLEERRGIIRRVFRWLW